MRLCIAGAGTAGLEALLAAREKLVDGTELVLIAPDAEFRYRPMSQGSLFRPAPERPLKIAELAADVRATVVPEPVEAVDEPERRLLTRAGDTIEFDSLLLAVGARSERPLRQGQVWIRGGDPGCLDQIIGEIASGEAPSVAVAVPRGARWVIPAYELSLALAWTAARTSHADVTLLTAEQEPLGMLGSEASRLVGSELDEAGVEVLAGVEVSDALEDEARVPERPRLLVGRHVREFDHLISLPQIVGPFLAGTPTDAAGFIEVDEHLKVCGTARVWAAGRCIAAALEHDGLGACQADAAVAAIAGERDVTPPHLAGILLSGQREAWLAENPLGAAEPSTRCLWWPSGRAVGHMLARRIAAWDPDVEPRAPDRPAGLPINAPVALGCNRTLRASGARPDAETRQARLRDIENRQLMAVRRQERVAEEELGALRSRLAEFSEREQDVVRDLQHHGYLQRSRSAS